MDRVERDRTHEPEFEFMLKALVGVMENEDRDLPQGFKPGVDFFPERPDPLRQAPGVGQVPVPVPVPVGRIDFRQPLRKCLHEGAGIVRRQPEVGSATEFGRSSSPASTPRAVTMPA